MIKRHRNAALAKPAAEAEALPGEETNAENGGTLRLLTFFSQSLKIQIDEIWTCSFYKASQATVISCHNSFYGTQRGCLLFSPLFLFSSLLLLCYCTVKFVVVRQKKVSTQQICVVETAKPTRMCFSSNPDTRRYLFTAQWKLKEMWM